MYWEPAGKYAVSPRIGGFYALACAVRKLEGMSSVRADEMLQ
jgi:hypothetical protein